MSNLPTEELPRESAHVSGRGPDRPLYRRVELATNLAILFVAVLLSVVLVKKFLIPGVSPEQVANTIKLGTQMTIPEISWQEREKTVLLFLSPRCGSCTESAPFYRQLAEQARRAGAPRIIALFPGDLDAARQYLAELEIPLTTVLRANPKVTGVNSSPTLLVVDQSGRVVGSWRGKLPEDKQEEVLKHFPPDGHVNLERPPIARTL